MATITSYHKLDVLEVMGARNIKSYRWTEIKVSAKPSTGSMGEYLWGLFSLHKKAGFTKSSRHQCALTCV